MSGIAGIARSGERTVVERMLERISHRGPGGREILETEEATLGVVWTRAQADTAFNRERKEIADDAGAGHFALVRSEKGTLVLIRDELGAAPLYYGRTQQGALCFASEVKALLEVSDEVRELPPGHRYDGSHMEPYFQLEKKPPLKESPEHIAEQLHQRLEAAVRKGIRQEETGSWLSGGLDSSAMAALTRPRLDTLHTFSIGLAGAPDLGYAQEVASFVGSNHHEIVVTVEEIFSALPQTIWHLESFDALLVRSSVTNYLLAQAASEQVAAVFSGEGGDELFAGYDYLKSVKQEKLEEELIDITGRLHNTAFQRVDRCASAHGTVALLPFADPEVVDCALRIPVEMKLHHGVEKWILRKAMEGRLPESVLKRTKAKFWEGAGVSELLATHAENRITDTDFGRERSLPNGCTLNSKEELLYYRIFREQFGDKFSPGLIGRTKIAPRQ